MEEGCVLCVREKDDSLRLRRNISGSNYQGRPGRIIGHLSRADFCYSEISSFINLHGFIRGSGNQLHFLHLLIALKEGTIGQGS